MFGESTPIEATLRRRRSRLSAKRTRGGVRGNREAPPTPTRESFRTWCEPAASAADPAELDARTSVCRACPRLVAWRETVAAERRAAFRDQEITPPTILSLAKQEEEIYLPGADEPLRLSRHSFALRLLQYVRDEAHRFAQHYHHLLRRKRQRGE